MEFIITYRLLTGYYNWKKALEWFTRHGNYNTHRIWYMSMETEKNKSNKDVWLCMIHNIYKIIMLFWEPYLLLLDISSR